MRRLAKFIILSLVTILLLAIFYFFFPHVWGELLYPLDYRDSIKKYSDQRSLRPNLVAAVIYTESRFNPSSTSSVGAQGLMQIMPGTGQSIAGELGEPMGDLYNPEVSIRYGSWYLKGLLDKYNGNLDLALAAYNAGVPRADKYKDKVMPLPYETVFFVQKVKGAEGMYDKVHDAWYSKSQSEKRNPVTVGFANLGDFVKKLILGNK
ncbi:MAG TPA: lytic transglycosylase domain-containing protein [Patescibacteria group bacterium]|nr:lytic transglycosylase domain-containing protein [Patescibacteria group bacterium]